MKYKLNPKRKKSIADKILVLIFLSAYLAAAVMPVPNVSAAEVFTKDQGLEGSVVGVTAEGVEFVRPSTAKGQSSSPGRMSNESGRTRNL
jgi:hypothetical protein